MAEQVVDVCFGEAQEKAGRLAAEAGKASVLRFAYDEGWLARGRPAVSPDLPLQAGWQLLRGDGRRPMPLAFADTEPDRWGRLVADRCRLQADAGALSLLLAAGNAGRLGALQFFPTGAAPCAITIPPEKTLPKLAQAVRRLEAGRDTADDWAFLSGCAVTMGGARPKCLVTDSAGWLCLAKFASLTDERDIEKGELLLLALARKAGLRAAECALRRVGETSVGLIQRFDRTADGRRVPYWSAATYLQDEAPSYLALFEALALETDDWQELGVEIVKRMLLNCLASSFDDHAHNTGVLQMADGRWTLAPAFDLNPVPLKRPDAPYESKLWLTPEEGPVTSVRQILSVADRFGLDRMLARQALREVLVAVTAWRTTARAPLVGMTARDLSDYAPAFEHVRKAEALSLAA